MNDKDGYVIAEGTVNKFEREREQEKFTKILRIIYV